MMSVEICVIVPAGTFELSGLVEAVDRFHPEVSIVAVWGGDSHHRPPLPDRVHWIDLDLPEPTGAGWGRLLAALPARAAEWSRASRAVARRLRDDASSVLVIRLGSVAVVGRLDDWWPTSGLVAIERVDAPPPLDGLAPTGGDLADRGRWSDAVVGIAADGVDALDRLGDLATDVRENDQIGQVVAAALDQSRVDSPSSGLAVGWRSPAEALSLLDIDDLHPDEPWSCRFGGRRARLLLSDEPDLAAAVAASSGQRVGHASPIVLPGGVVVDRPIRRVMADAIEAWRRGDDDLPPDPFGAAGIVEWLESPSARSGGAIGRYWFEEWAGRPDLHVVFPDPMGADRARFLQWADDSWRSDGRSALVRATVDDHIEHWADVDRADGINVIGYIASDSGLGDFTRRVYRSLDAAGVPVAALHYGRTASPNADDAPELTTDVRNGFNLITVHADQMGFFADDHGAEVFAGRTNVGYWFWELSELTPRVIESIDLVDEVWAATEFVADAYRRVTDKPVRVVPIPVPEPSRSTAERAELGLPDDRFVFLATLDHLSITDRKNPIAAIRAFELAFPTPSDDGPVLMVKTLNGSQRWSEHEELQLAAASRPDVTVLDRHLSRADQMRLIEASDCLVSLHRSEGLGLHLMEAMWVRTPVIATRYSGNLDFMNDDNSLLVDAELIPVADRQGYYPTSAVWADPRPEDAATAMQRLAHDEVLRQRLADAAHHDMMNQRSMTHTGHLIARLCREATPAAAAAAEE